MKLRGDDRSSAKPHGIMNGPITGRPLTTLIGGTATRYYAAVETLVFHGQRGYSGHCHQHSTLGEADTCAEGAALPALVCVVPYPHRHRVHVVNEIGEIEAYDAAPGEPIA